jgi:hypothetical protein
MLIAVRRCCPLLVAAAVALAAPASAQDYEKMRQVKLTTDPVDTYRCAKLGVVRDDSMKDLRKKIVRAGGNVGLLNFTATDMAVVYAEVFRCPPPEPPGSPPPGRPPDVPPPPPGAPPPRPPGPVR